MFEPSYLALHRSGELAAKAEALAARLKCCDLCPRECRVDRTTDDRGFCRVGDRAMVSSFNPHFGEEEPLVGRHGSGTIFLSNGGSEPVILLVKPALATTKSTRE